MARLVALLAAGLVAMGAVDAPRLAAGDLHGRWFHTPSRDIACEVDEHAAVGTFRGRRTLFCVVFSASSDKQGQRTWLMTTTGRPHVTWVVGNIATETPSLEYGRSWSFEAFRCRSQRIGLRCSNRSRHGFFLSRERQRGF